MRRIRSASILLTLLALALAACAESVSAPGVIESYLKAKIAADENKIAGLSCAAWEAQAILEAAPFRSVKAELDGLACRENGQDGGATLVTCEGTLIITYRGEAPRQQSLAGTTYRAVKEDGAWKMCGQQ